MTTHIHTSQQELDNDAVITLVSETNGYETKYRISIFDGNNRALAAIEPSELEALQGQITLILGQHSTHNDECVDR